MERQSEKGTAVCMFCSFFGPECSNYITTVSESTGERRPSLQNMTWPLNTGFQCGAADVCMSDGKTPTCPIVKRCLMSTLNMTFHAYSSVSVLANSLLKEQRSPPYIHIYILEIPLGIQNLLFNYRSWELLYENSKRNQYSSSRILQVSRKESVWFTLFGKLKYLLEQLNWNQPKIN